MQAFSRSPSRSERLLYIIKIFTAFICIFHCVLLRTVNVHFIPAVKLFVATITVKHEAEIMAQEGTDEGDSGVRDQETLPSELRSELYCLQQLRCGRCEF